MLNSASAGITSLAILIGTHVAFAQTIACPEQPRNEPLEKGDPLRRTLVITEPAILNRDTFSLARTLDAIIQSGRKVEGANPPVAEAERIALLQSVIDSFGTTEVENPDSHIRITVDERPAEHALKPTKLLNQSDDDFMRPVALFNRFDLAPRGFEYCGEHRIVYAKGGRGSFFLIFEAALSLPETKKKTQCKRARSCMSLRRKILG